MVALNYFRKRVVIENLILGSKSLLVRGVFVGEEDSVEIYVRRRLDIDRDLRHLKILKRPRGLHSKSQQSWIVTMSARHRSEHTPLGMSWWSDRPGKISTLHKLCSVQSATLGGLQVTTELFGTQWMWLLMNLTLIGTGSNATVHFRNAKNSTSSHFSFLVDLLATCDFKDPRTISTNEK